MGFKDFLIELGLMKGKYKRYEAEFDANVSIEKVEMNFEKSFISLKSYGSAWKLSKSGAASSGRIVFELSLKTEYEPNKYIFTKKDNNSVHVAMTVLDYKSNHADYLWKSDKKLVESLGE